MDPAPTTPSAITPPAPAPIPPLRGSRPPIPVSLDTLPVMPIADLRALWSAHMGRAAAPAAKRLLIRELAWRTQERRHGGLDAQIRRQLHRAIRAASKSVVRSLDDGDQHASTPPASSAPPTPKRRPRGTASTNRVPGPDLPPGARLTRTWHGQRHEVHALGPGRGFAYRDRTYATLSEIAREITGTRWSGPRFFGLTVRTPSKNTSDRA